MTTNIDLLIEQFNAALEIERTELVTLEASLRERKGKVAALEAAAAALTGEPKAKRQKRVPRANTNDLRAGSSLKSKIVEVLEQSPTAMDLGAITRAVLGTDDARSRTRISAAISPVAQDPQGAIRRIGVGSYASRQLSPE